MKYFTKNVFAFLMAMTFVGLGNMTAQTAFWTYDFGDMAAFDTDWVNGGTNDGPETWVWSNDPSGIFNGQPDFAAPTAANGFTIFNSDANGNTPHDVTLTTANPIDCSGQSTVYFRSENQYSFFTQGGGSIASLGVSTDGVVFTYYPILESVAQNDLSSSSQIIILELPDAANQAEVWLQIRWQGNFEYIWRVDDVQLFDADPTPGIDYAMGDYFFYSPASFSQPMDQMDVDTLGFFGSVVNNGSDDVTNVELKATITDEAGAVLFETSSTVDVLEAGTTDTIDLPDLFGPDGLELGLYSINYEVSSADMPDSNVADNSVTRNFIVSEDTWSKENEPSFVSGVQDADGNFEDNTIANIYRTSPNIMPNTYEFGNVTFACNVDAANAPLAGKVATVLISKVREDVVDQFWNGFDDTGDMTSNDGLELVGFIPYTFPNDELTHTVPAVDFDGNPIMIEPGSRYIVGIRFEGADNVVRVAYSDEIDYLFAYSCTMIYTTEWFNVGFGSDRAATIRINQVLIDVATEDTPLPAESMTLFPNPANDQIALDIDLENTGKANIIMADMTGRIMKISEYENLTNGTYNFNVGNYPNGVYMARLVTADGSRTIKFTVQH